MKHSILLVFILCLTIFTTQTTFAQLSGSIGDDINVEMVPENPKPNEKVYISLNSYITNINSAEVTWTVNGEIKKTGIGEKTFLFTVGDMNTTTSLDVFIKTAEGNTVHKTYKIKPSSVDIIWEADTFTPPFYKGKALFTHESKVNIIAIPHVTGSSGAEISPSNLVYQWKNAGAIIDDASGYGKNTYTVTGNLISRPLDIEVTVSSLNNDSFAYNRVLISPTEPSVEFYEKNPLFGIEFQKALIGNTELSEPEIKVVAMPYFFSIKKLFAPELTYRWTINGEVADKDTSNYSQIFRHKEGTKGFANIKLAIENDRKILQFASGGFGIGFGNNENSVSNN